MNKILVICGPTATGKTALALKLANIYNGELVSADSRQVYIGMDIGTGKDLPKDPIVSRETVLGKFKDQNYVLKAYLINKIPVWIYDVVRPDEEFSVAHYQTLASAVINDIWRRKKLPVIVGGTGLFISSLINPPPTINLPPDKNLRQKLSLLSVDQLQIMLKKLSPGKFSELNDSDRKNPYRLIRRIEILKYLKTHTLKLPNGLSADVLSIGLTNSLPALYKKIDKRVDLRVDQGIIAEIKFLINSGYNWNLPSMNALGYQEWQDYFENNKSAQQIIQKWKFDEHGYARRQLTWFRKMKNIHWFKCGSAETLTDIDMRVLGWYTRN